MTDTTTRPAPAEMQRNRVGRAVQQRGDTGVAPQDRGRTTIADSVVEKIAAVAARETPGIHELGAGMARTVGAVRDRVPGAGSGLTQGVTVEVGERQAAVDLDVVVDYGVPIADICKDARSNIISAVERMTDLEVVEVNVAVDDVDLPDDGGAQGDRVT